VAAPELNDKEIEFLEALSRRQVKFMIVGLSAAALQGAPVVTQDVHLWFEDVTAPAVRDALRDVGAAYLPPMEMNPPMFAGKGVELFDLVIRMDGLGTFVDEYAGRIEASIRGTPVAALPLARILASKRATNRMKDRLVIPVLEDVLRVKGNT
jgi:hypothetical protein